MAKKAENLLSTPLHGLVIPVALVIFGTALMRPDWLPYSFPLAGALAAFRIWRGRPRKTLDANNYQSFELSDIIPVSHNTGIYRFRLPSSNHILGLPIGQHITVAATIDGKEIARSYTPISSDRDRGYFDLLVKAYPTGNISKYIANLKVGETIKVRGPKGQMFYKPGLVREFGMIAGGTGITPMLQIIHAILTNPSDTAVCHLIYANVNEEDILLREEIDALAQKDPRLHVHYVLNNPPPNWTGSVGFVTPDIIAKYCPRPAEDVKILMCGPPPMISALKKHTHELGFDKAKPISKLDDQVFAF